MNGVSEVKVWDPLVRIFHWSLVLAFTVAYFTEDDLLSLHVAAGYTVAGLVVFRLLWGIIGPTHARFRDFVASPATALRYAKDVLRGSARRFLGHNPAGGLMIVLLLISLVLTVASGLGAYGVEKHAGPLAGWLMGASESWGDALEEIHEFCANFTVFLVLLHVAGVVVESLVHRENLARAMVTGRKRA